MGRYGEFRPSRNPKGAGRMSALSLAEDQPFATTGGGGGGFLPSGALPIGPLPMIGSLPMIGIGSLPTGALPTTGVGGGGWRVGMSAAAAAVAKASVEAVRMRNFVIGGATCNPFEMAP